MHMNQARRGTPGEKLKPCFTKPWRRATVQITMNAKIGAKKDLTRLPNVSWKMKVTPAKAGRFFPDILRRNCTLFDGTLFNALWKD